MAPVVYYKYVNKRWQQSRTLFNALAVSLCNARHCRDYLISVETQLCMGICVDGATHSFYSIISFHTKEYEFLIQK